MSRYRIVTGPYGDYEAREQRPHPAGFPVSLFVPYWGFVGRADTLAEAEEMARKHATERTQRVRLEKQAGIVAKDLGELP